MIERLLTHVDRWPAAARFGLGLAGGAVLAAAAQMLPHLL